MYPVIDQGWSRGFGGRDMVKGENVKRRRKRSREGRIRMKTKKREGGEIGLPKTEKRVREKRRWGQGEGHPLCLLLSCPLEDSLSAL